MPFETEQINMDSGIVVLALSGSLTMGNQLQRFEWLVEDLTRKGSSRLIIDAAQLAYTDSAGIGVLVKCSAVAKQAGGKMILAGATERVMSTLKLLSLDAVLSVAANREEAALAF